MHTDEVACSSSARYFRSAMTFGWVGSRATVELPVMSSHLKPDVGGDILSHLRRIEQCLNMARYCRSKTDASTTRTEDGDDSVQTWLANHSLP